MPSPAGSVTGVQLWDGSALGPVACSTVDFSFTCVNTASVHNTVNTTTGLGPYRSARFSCNVQGNTGGTLDIVLWASADAGSTWFEYARLAQLAAAAASICYTFSISKGSQQTTITTVGVDTGSGTPAAPVIAAATVTGGDWGDRLRFEYYNGASTSLGKLQTIKAIFSP